MNFKGCDFSKVYLSEASLCGSTFENNIYIKGNSDYAIFKKSNIAGINAFRTSFYECNFSETTLTQRYVIVLLLMRVFQM